MTNVKERQHENSTVYIICSYLRERYNNFICAYTVTILFISGPTFLVVCVSLYPCKYVLSNVNNVYNNPHFQTMKAILMYKYYNIKLMWFFISFIFYKHFKIDLVMITVVFALTDQYTEI